nr:centromere protein W isoform X2 [Macaca fascicularis]
MALSTIVSQKKQIKRKAPRSFLKRVFKRQKPQLRLEKSGDLLNPWTEELHSAVRSRWHGKVGPSELLTVCSSISRRVQDKRL